MTSATVARTTALIVSLFAAATSACDRSVSHETEIGQWIWSATDSALFADAATRYLWRYVMRPRVRS